MFKNLFSNKITNPIDSVKSSSNRTYYFTNAYSSECNQLSYDAISDFYTKNSIIKKCVNLIAKNISTIPFDLILKDQSNNAFFSDNHPLLDLLSKPNHRMNKTNFFETIASYYLLTGNAFIHAIRNDKNELIGIDVLRPDKVKIQADLKQMSIDSYIYQVDENFILSIDVDQKTNMSNILHMKNFNSSNDWYGSSAIESILDATYLYNHSMKWNRNLLENGARPSGALVIKNNLSDSEFDRLKHELDDKISNSKNAGKVMILEGGIEWKEMSLNPKDMDFLESKHSAARDIAAIFGVPAQLLGIPGDTTYNNMIEARSFFVENTVLPMMHNICDSFSNWFSWIYNQDITLQIDEDLILGLTDKRQKLWDNLKGADFLTNEEKRSLIGFDFQNQKKLNLSKRFF